MNLMFKNKRMFKKYKIKMILTSKNKHKTILTEKITLKIIIANNKTIMMIHMLLMQELVKQNMIHFKILIKFRVK